MDNADVATALRGSVLSSELDDAQVAALARVSVGRRLEPGELLIEEGKCDETLYAVAEGVLEIRRPGPQGNDTPVHSVGAGKIVGEIGFLDGLARTASVRAKGPATVVGIRRDALEGLIDDDPWLAYRVMRAVVRSMYQVVTNLNRDNLDLVGYVMR